jgi:hypothetical protein
MDTVDLEAWTTLLGWITAIGRMAAGLIGIVINLRPPRRRRQRPALET